MSRAGRIASWWFAVVAVLGLVPRSAPATARSGWRRAEASGFEAPADAVNPLQFGRAYQLPPFGRGNGLEALFWTPLARVRGEHAEPVLAALARAGIAGWAAPVRSRIGAARGTGAGEDLWAASVDLERAQDVLMRALSRDA